MAGGGRWIGRAPLAATYRLHNGGQRRKALFGGGGGDAAIVYCKEEESMLHEEQESGPKPAVLILSRVVGQASVANLVFLTPEVEQPHAELAERRERIARSLPWRDIGPFRPP